MADTVEASVGAGDHATPGVESLAGGPTDTGNGVSTLAVSARASTLGAGAGGAAGAGSSAGSMCAPLSLSSLSALAALGENDDSSEVNADFLPRLSAVSGAMLRGCGRRMTGASGALGTGLLRVLPPLRTEDRLLAGEGAADLGLEAEEAPDDEADDDAAPAPGPRDDGVSVLEDGDDAVESNFTDRVNLDGASLPFPVSADARPAASGRCSLLPDPLPGRLSPSDDRVPDGDDFPSDDFLAELPYDELLSEEESAVLNAVDARGVSFAGSGCGLTSGLAMVASRFDDADDAVGDDDAVGEDDDDDEEEDAGDSAFMCSNMLALGFNPRAVNSDLAYSCIFRGVGGMAARLGGSLVRMAPFGEGGSA